MQSNDYIEDGDYNDYREDNNLSVLKSTNEQGHMSMILSGEKSNDDSSEGK